MKRFMWCLIFVLYIGPARAEFPADLDLEYVAYYGGLHAGDIFIQTRQLGKNKIVSTLNLESRGIIGLITHFKANFTSEGEIKNDIYQPHKYKSLMTSRGRGDRKSSWVLDTTQNMAIATKYGDRVKDKNKVGVTDPLAAILLMGPTLNNAKEVTFPVYDGKYRYDLTATSLGLTERRIQGKNHKVQHIKLKANPVDGIKKRKRKLWQEADIDVYLSTDGRNIPLQIWAKGLKSTAVVNLQGL